MIKMDYICSSWLILVIFQGNKPKWGNPIFVTIYLHSHSMEIQNLDMDKGNQIWSSILVKFFNLKM
jgi:hypothetical protein